MIEVLPIRDETKVKDFFESRNYEYKEGCGCVVARCGNDFLGYCTYILDKDKITVLNLEPTDDLMMADGILRSALHVADSRMIDKAFYSADSPEDIFKKLGFIKNQSERTLAIEKLKESCCGCKKNNN